MKSSRRHDGIRFAGPARVHPSHDPVVIEFGSASAAHSIIHLSRKTVVIEFGPESAVSIEIQSTSNSVRRPTRVYDPSKSSRPQIRVRVSGPFYHPLETVVIEFGSESAAQPIFPGHSPSQSSSNTSFQVAEIQTSLASISGRQSGLGRVYHPPNQICHPSKSSLSIIHWPGPHHRSLAPPSELEGAPSTDHHDLVNENILRFRLSLGASHTWSCCDDA